MLKDNFVSNSQQGAQSISIDNIVFEDAKRQLCKQFTTVCLVTVTINQLFLKMLKDNFVSNSQQYIQLIEQARIGFEDAKRQLCKQFTTRGSARGQTVPLFLKMLKDSFVSNSERYLTFVNYSLLSVDAIVKSLHSFHSFHNVKDLFNFA